MGDAGHQPQQGDTELPSVDNHGVVLGPIATKPINQPDTLMLPATLTTLGDFPRRMGIDRCGSSFTLEAGVDSPDKRDAIKAHQMPPVISPNRRHPQRPIAIARQCRWCDRAFYRLRYTVERSRL